MMNADLRKENIEILKNDYIDFIKTTMQETGGLYPSFTIFSEIKGEYDEDKPKIGLIHIPVPSKFMEDADTKDELLEEVLPEISKTIKKDFIPYALAWASEVWVRRVSKEEAEKHKNNLEKLIESAKKVEAIFINIESDDGNNIYVYEVVRSGKQVNNDGDLVDQIELIEAPDLSDAGKGTVEGRFANLFHLFK